MIVECLTSRHACSGQASHTLGRFLCFWWSQSPLIVSDDWEISRSCLQPYKTVVQAPGKQCVVEMRLSILGKCCPWVNDCIWWRQIFSGIFARVKDEKGLLPVKKICRVLLIGDIRWRAIFNNCFIHTVRVFISGSLRFVMSRPSPLTGKRCPMPIDGLPWQEVYRLLPM